ncbi:hypothetical protein [Desulfofustis glycolicus]|uniref:Uncharacterized protein n=1 Tax=Desulfofustis glycolicus DSM 9705 TaxID=1121409 RepID=A0A1M5XTB4_9BACT|nr:hypothetical protein [Desulfofustis glycolicus]MCB2217243.1 hypothetical protein [Desulfobulbaceae bacterium]SHI03016.1 hypothetical protein SAMN02745124_03325 [Desulfofustis glycolicus DSM 9705]
MKRYLTIVISLTLLFYSSQFLYAGHEGQLYWLVGDDQENFFLYNTFDLYQGAENAIDQACLQAPGIGTFSGEIRVPSSLNFPAEKAGYCQNNRPLVPGTFDGNLYYAFLYCNGDKREMMDDSSCEVPSAVLDLESNQGPPCLVD